MRKPQKSALAKAITHGTTPIEHRSTETKYVLDGEALLHRVKWYKTGSYLDTISLYLQYVAKRYGHENIIVFDGYTSEASTKDHKHQRRSSKSSSDVTLDECKTIHSNQHTFLANPVNKTQFIALLSRWLKVDGHRVRQSVTIQTHTL